MMDERRLKRAYKRSQRKRRAALVLVTCLFVVVVFAIVFVASLMANHKTFADLLTSQNGSEAVSTAEEDASVAEDTSSEESIPDDQAVFISDNQLYQGDLILVNKDHAYNFDANADNIPLITLSEESSFKFPIAKDEFQLSAYILTYLEQFMGDCDEAAGSYDTGISSAYRSLEYQQNVYDEIAEEKGTEYADQYVATPGYSEHHTGIAVDFGVFDDDGSEGSFSGSNNATWMLENCYKYGFIRRYAENKVDITGISNEAWHFRYVGVPHATYMYNEDLCLEEYIDFLKTKTEDDPLVIDCSTGTFKVWYTDKTKIRKPENNYSISGNNVDGYIITENITAE